jgi:aminoglycoside phosphotransferase (APT) family kinase protein
MDGVTNTAPALEQVRAFLDAHHGKAVDGIEPLGGGFWSSAYGYRVDDLDLVLRLGRHREWFETDRAAMAYSSPELPVPDVLDIGDAFDGSYAISVRRYGRFLETVMPHEAETAGPLIVRLLTALKAVPSGGSISSWQDWLRAGLVDQPGRPQSGWRAKLAAEPTLDALFDRCRSRVDELMHAVPERRDLVHGDLLHSNVLIDADASRVNAIFSWKCSTRGDFMFDVAWCTFWGAFHPGIAAAAVFDRVASDPSMAADPQALDRAAQRHHCYELHIGATHLGWHAWTGERDALDAVAAQTAKVLERGPLRR